MFHKHALLFILTGVFTLFFVGCATNTSATQTAAQTPTNTPVSSTDSNSIQVDTATETTTVETTAPTEVAAATITKLNLNTATGDEYKALIPNFSDRMVREFLEYRPYISIQQFRREIGKYVDDAQIAEYEKYVYVPVDVDESDAATLMQLPGVDEAIANELMAARPFGSNDAFLAKLAEFVSEGDLANAAAYLAP